MVRINLINPKLLTDQHLIAEYHEIYYLVSSIKNHWLGRVYRIPRGFSLGKGHQLFFTNKLEYLYERHWKLCMEIQNRGFNYDSSKLNKLWFRGFGNWGNALFGYWSPNIIDEELTKLRILEKIKQKPDWYRYYGQVKPVKFYENLYNGGKTK